MTRLRQQMLDELERRNYSASTVRAYIRTVEDLARYFKRRPDQLGPEHIRQYQAHLFRDRKLAANTVAQRVAALRFFYIRTLGQEWNLDRAPYPKRPRRLPNILSPQQVARLINAADSAFHRMIVMTLYATGVRRAELTQLQIQDIDSERMVVHVRGGKGRKDRDVMLSEPLLVHLREHIRRLRRRPSRAPRTAGFRVPPPDPRTLPGKSQVGCVSGSSVTRSITRLTTHLCAASFVSTACLNR